MQWLKCIALSSLNSLSWIFTFMHHFTLFLPFTWMFMFSSFRENLWERVICIMQFRWTAMNCICCCNTYFLWFSGLTYLVYPGAVHTRFEHSLGVYSLAGKAINNLKTYQVCVASIWILKLTEMLKRWSVKVKVLFYFDREKNLELIMLTCRL